MEPLALVIVSTLFVVLAQDLGPTLAMIVALAGSAGVGGFVMAFLTLRETRRQRVANELRDSRQESAKEKIDVLSLSQSSLLTALDRADGEIERCHAEIESLRAKLEIVEERERECLDRIRVLEARL